MAKTRRVTLALPEGPAAATLSTLAEATGIAIGWQGGLPARLPALRGALTAPEALRRLLAGSGFRALRVGHTAYRIVPVRAERPGPSRERRRDRPPALAAPSPTEILVTGQKRDQTLQDVAISVSFADLTTVQTGQLAAGTRDVAAAVDGLAVTNLGPGRNRQFIRGVADSPFDGPSQSTVAVQLDEARITFDAPDPDIRVVDMERIEVLKGPQGPLYGSGALGGIYHLVTRKPDLLVASGMVRAGAGTVAEGGRGGGGDVVLNLPLAPGRLAVRAVGYASREAGWIDNVGRDRDANPTMTTGARLSLRWQPGPAWTIDLSGVLQDVNTRDSQYVTASGETIRRVVSIREPSDNDFKAAVATVKGTLGALDLLGTSSVVKQQVEVVLDATPAAAGFGLSGAARFDDDRSFRLINNELRISSSSGLRWLAGVSSLDARSRTRGLLTDANRSLPIERVDRAVSEIAAFGEFTLPIAATLRTTVGARLFRSQAEDEAVERAGGTVDRTGKTALSPSVAFSWAPERRTLVYLRYARAERPGGLAPAGDGEAASRRFGSDRLGTFDLGARLQRAGGKLSANVSAFLTNWQDIQSDYLLPSGLISTRNAGDGRIIGLEFSASWQPRGRLLLEFGTTWVDAKLVRTASDEELDDRRLPVTPDLAARALARYRFDLGTWTTIASLQANYTGHSRLSFDPALDRRMGGYAIFAAGLSASRSALSVSLRVDNLLDARGDSFAFGNPFSVASTPQFTPNRPRTVSVTLSRRW